MSEADKNKQGQKPNVSKLAVGAFGLAIASIVTVFLTSPIAVVLGIISIFKIQNSKGKLKGASFAIAAIIIGTVGAIWSVYVGIPRIRSVAPRMVCGTNLSGLGYAMFVYANDYDDQYPTVDKWCDLLIAEGLATEKQFKCPAIKNKKVRCTYAINPNCQVNSPPDTVLLFESDGGWEQPWGWNQSGGLELLNFTNHRGGGFCILYNDGHVRFENPKSILYLNWGDEQNNE